MPRQLPQYIREPRAGDPVSASLFGEMVRALRSDVYGEGVIDGPGGMAIVPTAGSGGTATARWAKITQAEGAAPPFLYSAVEMVSAANGTFNVKPGGLTVDGKLYNLGETVYPGAGKIPVNRVVLIWRGSGCYLCDVLTYRGTFG